MVLVLLCDVVLVCVECRCDLYGGRKFQQVLIHIVCAALLFGLAYLMWQTGGQFAITGETTAQLKITKAPFIQGMGLLCGLAGLVHLAKAFLPTDDNASEGGTV